MLLYVSRKVTVPPDICVAPAFTVAVIVITDPLAALAGFTDRMVVVAVCALATYDVTKNKAKQNDTRGVFRREFLAQFPELLEMPNALSAAPKIRGTAIASKRNAARKRDCRSTHFAGTRENQCDLHAASPRKTFKITRICEPFD